jgi:hypothetical protein
MMAWPSCDLWDRFGFWPFFLFPRLRCLGEREMEKQIVPPNIFEYSSSVHVQKNCTFSLSVKASLADKSLKSLTSHEVFLHSAKPLWNEYYTRQIFYRQIVLYRVLFSGTRQRFCWESKNTRQIKNHKKTSKPFLIRGTTPNHHHVLWPFFELNSHVLLPVLRFKLVTLSRAQPTLPLNHYISCVYLCFSSPCIITNQD